MPPLPPVPGVIKFVAEGTTGAYPWANVFHWSFTGSRPSPGAMGSLCGIVYTAFAGQFMPQAPTPTHLLKVTGVDLTDNTGASNEHDQDTAGTSTFDKLPGNVAILVSKQIALRYRGGHPRTYLYIGGDGNLQDPGHWQAAFATTVTTEYGAFQSSINGNAAGGTVLGQEVIVSYISKEVNPVPPFRRPVPLVLPVTAFFVQQEIASQRRRIGR